MARLSIVIASTAVGSAALLLALLAVDITDPPALGAIHIVAASVTIVVFAGLAALNIRMFLGAGQARHLALATAFLLFAASYVWHASFTTTGHSFTFAIYAPISRLLFGAALIGFASPRSIESLRRLPYAFLSIGAAIMTVLIGYLLADPINAWAGSSTSGEMKAAQIVVDVSAITLLLIALIRLLLQASDIPSMPLITAATTLLIMESVYFIPTTTWTITWWAGHGVGLVSTLMLAGTVWVSHQREERRREEGRRGELDSMKSEFINTAAHELGTPLTPIRLQLHVLLGQAQTLTENQSRSLQLIHRNVERLDGLVKRILDSSKSMAGKLEFEVEEFDLATAVRELCESYRPMCDQGSISLHQDVPQQMTVRSDPYRLEQVITSLLNNALKYTDAGGSITVSLVEQPRFAILRVKDDGQGIDAKLKHRLFQPFSQGHDQLRDDDGPGLGLFLSRQIIEGLGGQIRAASPGPGRGSTFEFRIPRAWAAEAA